MLAAHWQYFTHVLRHKWYVLLACQRLRVPWWQAVLHDVSKFRPCEWFAYVEYFSIQHQPAAAAPLLERRSYAGRRLAEVQPAMDRAWLHHLQANAHHWQHWVVVESATSLKPLPMPERYYREMIADWIGAGRVQRKHDVAGWYAENQHRVLLHPETRERVDVIMRRLTP